jgi:hypothetical protein
LRGKIAGDRLALLDIEGGRPGSGLREAGPTDGEPLLLLAFGDETGQRGAVALPGTASRAGDRLTVLAPLQPGQAGAPAFDRQGRLVGIVSDNPSDRLLIAGIAPQRSYTLIAAKELQPALAGLPVPGPEAVADQALSTGALVQKLGPAVLPVLCAL